MYIRVCTYIYAYTHVYTCITMYNHVYIHVLDALGALLGASWTLLGHSWGPFWPHLDDLGVSRERLGAMGQNTQNDP